jgi:tRNA G18 (ribose-2'-O)-methylase SpoU
MKKIEKRGKAEKREIFLLLHNIRSVYNVGAIFRTADAVGVSKIILSGYTPTPLDRFRNARKDFAKCSLGAEKNVAWEYIKTPAKTLVVLKKGGFEIISVEQSKNSVDYKKVKPKGKSLVIFGTEVSGISKSILEKSDIIAEIPMKGKKESLNVSVSAGIVLYRWFDQ